MPDSGRFDGGMKGAPFPVHARLRAESPVHCVENFDYWTFFAFRGYLERGQNRLSVAVWAGPAYPS